MSRRGKLVHFETHGLMDVDNNRPMQKDAIFIMMSSTKPLLGVAAMMIEEGLIRPDDPVSKYIPEFADMQVVVLRSTSYQVLFRFWWPVEHRRGLSEI